MKKRKEKRSQVFDYRKEEGPGLFFLLPSYPFLPAPRFNYCLLLSSPLYPRYSATRQLEAQVKFPQAFFVVVVVVVVVVVAAPSTLVGHLTRVAKAGRLVLPSPFVGRARVRPPATSPSAPPSPPAAAAAATVGLVHRRASELQGRLEQNTFSSMRREIGFFSVLVCVTVFQSLPSELKQHLNIQKSPE